MTRFNVAVTSDTVCPWCYVGKKKLEAGIAAYKEAHPDSNDTFDVEWKPFYLNPDAPRPGVDKQKYYEDKFGGGPVIKAMQERLSGIGKQNGIHFKFGGKIGNTRDSHRLIQLAKTKGPEAQTKVIEQLFERYFENEQDITSLDTLKEAGVAAGLPHAEVDSWLNGESGGPEVDREVAEARRNMVTGVPNFVLQDKYEVQGAQDAAGFKMLFEKIKEKEG
jgi:predicted DsbA family dithiol-disulfide isomerase